MSSRAVTFTSLKGILGGLGCRLQAVPGSHAAFEHPASGALIVLRFYRDEETVSPTDLALAGRVLDDFGVLPREDFEAALRQGALAG